MSGNLLIEYYKIQDLKPYEKNARKHTKKDIKTIVESIREFGFNDPVGIWSDDNLIVEGHGRLLAAKELGMKEVPCIRLDHMTDEQRRAYALAHNKTAEMSEWDMDILPDELAGVEEIDMRLFGFEFPNQEENEPIEEDEYSEDCAGEPKAKQGQIYKLGNHYLMCGDSTNEEDIKLLINNNNIKLVLTDPPYGINVVQSRKIGGVDPYILTGGIPGAAVGKVGGGKYSTIKILSSGKR